MKKAISIVSIILGVVLLAGIAFGIYALVEATYKFKAKPSSFWLDVDGQRCSADSEIDFTQSSVVVNYLASWLTRKRGYTYKVEPLGEDFTFRTDGTERSWLEQDLTPAFGITEYDNGFTVKGVSSLSDLLHSLYPEQTIDVVLRDIKCKLVVTSVDGKAIEMIMSVKLTLEGITLSPPAIVF